MIKPGRDLLGQVNQAFLDHGYSGLLMIGLARACGFTQRALYYYFSNKEGAFRAMIAWRHGESVALALEAGSAVRAGGVKTLSFFGYLAGSKIDFGRFDPMFPFNAALDRNAIP